jgi:hypothetical protein
MSRIVSLTCIKGPVNLVTPENNYFARYAPLHAGVLATADDLRSKFPKAANGGLLEVVNELRTVVKVSDAADEALVKLYGATDLKGQIRSIRALNDALSTTRDSLDGVFGSLLMGDSLPKVRAHFVTSASYALLQVAIAHGLTDPDESAKVTLSLGAQRTFETTCRIVFEK